MNVRLREEEQYFAQKFIEGISNRKRKINYENLEITFYMSSPISLTSPWMFFDSLCGELLLKEALRDDYYVLPTKYPVSLLLRKLEMPPFPIKVTDSIYHSSVSIFDINSKYLETLYKKFEDRWAYSKRKIQKGCGYYREYMIRSLYIPATEIKFYICGDGEELEKICWNIVGLGDNTRIGWGAVRAFKITPIERDYSIVKEGKAMRPIPLEYTEKAEDCAMLSWRPPYWEASHVTLCAVPFSDVVLKKEFLEKMS